MYCCQIASHPHHVTPTKTTENLCRSDPPLVSPGTCLLYCECWVFTVVTEEYLQPWPWQLQPLCLLSSVQCTEGGGGGATTTSRDVNTQHNTHYCSTAAWLTACNTISNYFITSMQQAKVSCITGVGLSCYRASECGKYSDTNNNHVLHVLPALLPVIRLVSSA